MKTKPRGESSEAMGRRKERKDLADFLVPTISVASKLLITGKQERVIW